MLPNLFYEASITLIPKPDKGGERERERERKKEHRHKNSQ
jgi:hypothetical protein